MNTKAPKASEECLDGADKEMLPHSNKSDNEENAVNYPLAEKQNGDAKIEIDDKVGFVGMGKEELMRYANDPFWVRLRWILFILFWLIWLLMLVGAIVIIVVAPKCAPPQPRTWWEQGPIVEIDAPNAELIEHLKSEGVQAVIIPGGGDSYMEVDTLISGFPKTEVNIIVDLHPVSTKMWLNASEHKQTPFEDYYVWADPRGASPGGEPLPPNNWLSPRGGSAWKYSDVRQQFYLAQMGVPDLNFRNKDVITEFSSVLQKWLTAGARGVRLSGVDKLLVDSELRNDNIGSSEPGTIHDDYEFYTHTYTRNQEDIATVLVEWKNLINKSSNDKGILTLKEDIDLLEPYSLNGTLLVNLPRFSGVFNFHARQATAYHIHNGIVNAKAMLGDAWPAWEYVPGSLSTDVLDIVTMLLPGTPIIYIGENKQWTIDPALIQARTSPSVMFGAFDQYLLQNDTVYAYTRVKSGNPGYLVACNPSNSNSTVDFTEVSDKFEDLTVFAVSHDYLTTDLKLKSKIHAKSIPILSKSAIVFTYVP